MHIKSLLAAAVTVLCLHTSVSQSPAAEDHWVWGRRDPAATPTAIADGGPSRAQRRHGRFIDARTPTALLDVTAPFKSISARSFPNLRPLTLRGTTQEVASHFDVFSQYPVPESQNLSDPFKRKNVLKKPIVELSEIGSQPTLITSGDYPYPFGAKPIDLGDGTSIGWAPEDTLLIKETPANNGHSTNQFEPPSIAEDLDARYTTLDKLFTSRGPTKLPDTHELPNDVLGGLHPDEVFYADKDLVIIKGGGFTTVESYHADENLNSDKRATGNPIRLEHSGNELGEANNLRAINVRPDEQFSKVPLPFRFINGNIPTIVKQPSRSFESNRQGSRSQTHSFRPLHQTSFTPLTQQYPAPNLYYPSSSHQVNTLSSLDAKKLTSAHPTRDYQTLDEEEGEILQGEPSINEIEAVIPPTKRSADSNVVHYHYQTRGNHAIVDYKVHRQNSGPSRQPNRQYQIAPLIQNQNRNSIPLSIKENATNKRVNTQSKNEQNGNVITENFDELEDLSTPEGINNFVPKVQIPRRRPNFQSSPPHPSNTNPLTVSTPAFSQTVSISLHGDTRVNFLHPRPPINRHAEFIGRRPGVKTNRGHGQIPVTLNRPTSGQHPTRFVPNPGQVRGQGGSQFTRPTVIRQLHPIRPQQNPGFRRGPQNGPGNRRMEPRRRTPLTRRQPPKL